jgi:hypothetical protein
MLVYLRETEFWVEPKDNIEEYKFIFLKPRHRSLFILIILPKLDLVHPSQPSRDFQIKLVSTWTTELLGKSDTQDQVVPLVSQWIL